MSDDQTLPIDKSKQLPLTSQLKSSTSSSSASSSSNLPSRQSSGSDIRNDRNPSVLDRPPSRSRSARPSLGTESSIVSSGFSSGFGSRRHSVSHGNLPTNSESTFFPPERPHNSSNEIILRSLAAIENRLQQQNEDLQKNFTQLHTVLEDMSHKFSECCEAMNLLRLSSPTANLSDIILSGVSSLRSSRQANMASPNPIVSITPSPSPNDSPLLDQKSASRKTSELALPSRTMQTTKV